MLNVNNFKQLVCPKCHGSLNQEATGYRCTKCSLNFPQIKDAIIPFFKKPDAALALAYWSLFRTSKRLENQSAKISKALRKTSRKQTLLPVVKAIFDNRQIFRNWMQNLESQVKPERLAEILNNNSGEAYGYNFNYLARDWSDKNSDAAAHIIGNLENPLANAGGNSCFLGIGTARLAVEFADKFDSTWGIDSSFGQAIQFNSLLNNPLGFWETNTRNLIDSTKAARKLTAKIPDKLKTNAKKINYIWGDSLNSPFKANFFDWVISIYFTDVEPLPKLVKETGRILKPGGYYLHYGPLHYHSQKLENHYAYDEVKQYFIDSDFEIVYDSTANMAPDMANGESLLIPMKFIDKILLVQKIHDD